MNKLIALFSFLALASLAHSFNVSDTIRKMEKVETDLETTEHKQVELLATLFDHIENLKLGERSEAKNRKRRAICGRKLTKMALLVCGSFDRSPATEIDLSQECCTHKSCDDEFIKKAMCPDGPDVKA